MEAMKLLMEEKNQKTAMELLNQYLQFKQDSVKDTKKKGKEKDPSKPKQPLSAFFLYSNERRTSLAENKNVLEIAKLTGEEWKNMCEDKKAPYKEIAKKEKERYMKEMELYKLKKAQEAENIRQEVEESTKLQKHEALQLLKKKEKTEKMIKDVKDNNNKKKNESKDIDKPKRPATSFLLFSKEARKVLAEENPNNTSLSALISIRWKELTEEEKKIWNAKAAKEMAAYKTAMEEYNKKSSGAEKSKQ